MSSSRASRSSSEPAPCSSYCGPGPLDPRGAFDEEAARLAGEFSRELHGLESLTNPMDTYAIYVTKELPGIAEAEVSLHVSDEGDVTISVMQEY